MPPTTDPCSAEGRASYPQLEGAAICEVKKKRKGVFGAENPKVTADALYSHNFAVNDHKKYRLANSVCQAEPQAMWLIPAKKLENAALPPCQRYFLELWANMTHARSLDSYRVRCMNSRTIVRELADELRIGLVDDSDFDALCKETLAILNEDPVVQAAFPTCVKVLKPFLESPPRVKYEKGKACPDDEAKRRSLLFAAEDVRVALERDYFQRLCETCPSAVKPTNEPAIAAVTGSLLSDLVDQGWTLEALYRWHKHFLPEEKAPKYGFDENLEFMLRQLKRGAQPFEVTLRLSGTDKLSQVSTFGPFTMSDAPPPSAQTLGGTKFCKAHQYVRFATATMHAVDAISAAIEARTSFEQLLDLLRYDYERRTVTIEETCFVCRCGDDRKDFPRVLHSVANPVERVKHEGFLRFVRDFDAVRQRSGLSEAARFQLQAAIRQYRFGRDSEGYKDKFLNWWMGLEALCHTERGKGIGPTVSHNVSRAMLKDYLRRTLQDLLTTLKHSRIEWPKDLADHSACGNVRDLALPQLAAVLQSNQHLDLLCDQCGDHPVLEYRIRETGQWMVDPKKTVEQLERHRSHLEWHLSRLYRIRCCIVHGSPIRFRLGLFVANLEYYLKQLILFVLHAFRDNDHLHDLEELFRRSSIAYDRIIERLKDQSAGPSDIRAAVFADVVVKESVL